MRGGVATSRGDTLLVVAPFWGMAGHVGVYRVDRFVRWAAAYGARVVVVRAAGADRTAETPWGLEVTVRDPLGFYHDAPEAGPAGTGAAITAPPRSESRLRRAVATTVLSPDPGVVWARMAARHPIVLAAGRGARWVVSSSPPESAHLAAWRLARRLGAVHLADLRDGWLDEPLKPALARHALRRWHEGRWERRVVTNAGRVFVTSPVWRDLLTARYPEAVAVTRVLTNGYPPTSTPEPEFSPEHAAPGRLTLLHAGQFTASRHTQTVERLLRPLLEGVRRSGVGEGTIRLLGTLTPTDVDAVRTFASAFAEVGWRVDAPGRVARADALRAVQDASGLLLLSATPPTLPSKLFEYLPARRPILAVAPRDSAVWQLCAPVAHVYLVDARQPESAEVVAAFVRAAAAGERPAEVPSAYTEDALAGEFRAALAATGRV